MGNETLEVMSAVGCMLVIFAIVLWIAVWLAGFGVALLVAGSWLSAIPVFMAAIGVPAFLIGGLLYLVTD